MREKTKDDLADLGSIVRTKYRFKPHVLCPFCGRTSADTTLDVDLNAPFRDMIAVFDDGVSALPCCSPCKARHIKWDNRSLDLPLLLGYPMSVLHRLTYRAKVREWLRRNAEVVEKVESIPPLVQKEMLSRALRFTGYSALVAVGATATTLLAYWRASVHGGIYVIYWGAILGGIISFFVGIVRLLKWRLTL
jgi:hypothetical protein